MHVIIIGGGEIGTFVSEVLIHEQHEVVVIEPDEVAAQRLQSTHDILVVVGSGASPAVLLKAGIAKADLVLAVTPTDEVNLIACMIAKKHGRAELRTVAQVHQAHYFGAETFSSDDLDPIDAIVHSERALANIALEMLRYAGSGELRELAGGKLVLLGMLLGAESPLIGETLASIRNDLLPTDSIVVAVHGAAGVRIPHGDDRLAVHERAYILTTPKHLTELTILSGHPWYRCNRVLLLGVGNTGFALATDLEAKGFSCTIIEQDHERAEWAAARLRNTTVLHGDATDPDLLQRTLDEQHADAVVSLLRDPERSLLLGLFAKSLGAKKVIVRCDKPEYAHLATKLGVDAIISRKRAVANAVLRYVSRGRIESALLLGDEDDAELVNFRVPASPRAALTSKPVKELGFPKDALLGAIVRDGTAFIATGDAMLAPGDELVVVCKPEVIADIEALLT